MVFDEEDNDEEEEDPVADANEDEEEDSWSSDWTLVDTSNLQSSSFSPLSFLLTCLERGRSKKD